MTDAFGRAVRDHHRGERTAPLRQGDGEATRDHPIEAFYFDAFDPESDAGSWLTSRVTGPLVDLGAGAGRHALWLQERFETVAVETSAALVETMRARGVADAREGDMFALREAFERDRFASAIAIGTQIGLAGSMRGLSAFLGDLAFVTTPDATAVVDCYDPNHLGAADLLGYREDPTPGLAHRVMWFAYDGETDPTLHFRLFSPDRLREAALGTGWEIEAIDRDGTGEGPHYRAALRKR
ncbi:class I SAM-dependent methyltransferase [Halorubrum kocurii]|uniref:Methyltransferase type 11 n=1 Tax=Halorubrum kocurii JCM 14978 TaxID=1230456 RepID=M0NRE9_9EURY|nr:class I SAM-dependent methyltransferase [Halorubrum kocurii]EMA59799.1 hypothetical protein C468_14343 [Halorubrum kocurii JCM 14978]